MSQWIDLGDIGADRRCDCGVHLLTDRSSNGSPIYFGRVAVTIDVAGPCRSSDAAAKLVEQRAPDALRQLADRLEMELANGATP